MPGISLVICEIAFQILRILRKQNGNETNGRVLNAKIQKMKMKSGR